MSIFLKWHRKIAETHFAIFLWRLQRTLWVKGNSLGSASAWNGTHSDDFCEMFLSCFYIYKRSAPTLKGLLKFCIEISSELSKLLWSGFSSSFLFFVKRKPSAIRFRFSSRFSPQTLSAWTKIYSRSADTYLFCDFLSLFSRLLFFEYCLSALWKNDLTRFGL